MTLVLTVNGPESIWLLADRRLSAKGRPPKDDGRKIMSLETRDGQAILGYAGLGGTALGTEPSDWMSAVFRGRNFLLEPSLNILADALKREFPPHMIKFPGQGGPEHHIIIPAFLNNKVRLYTIDLVFAPDRRSYNFRYTSYNTVKNPTMPPRLAMGGSGASYLQRNKTWIRRLLRLIRAHDRGHVSTLAVADYLAALNYEVHSNYEVHLPLLERTVGPSCIVAWRHKKDGVHKGGGGNQFYTDTTRERNSPCLPTIVIGFDIKALADHMMPRMHKVLPQMFHHNVQDDFKDDNPFPSEEKFFGPHDEKLR